jgi:hypothetical protein
MSPDEIDRTITQLNSLFQTTVNTTVPKCTINPDNQIPLSPLILNIIKHKNKLRRIWHKKGYRDTDYALKSRINCLNVMIKNMLAKHYEIHYITKLQNIKADPRIQMQRTWKPFCTNT